MIRRVFERERDFHRGRLIDRSDEMASAFDGPGRAVQCAFQSSQLRVNR